MKGAWRSSSASPRKHRRTHSHSPTRASLPKPLRIHDLVKVPDACENLLPLLSQDKKLAQSLDRIYTKRVKETLQCIEDLTEAQDRISSTEQYLNDCMSRLNRSLCERRDKAESRISEMKSALEVHYNTFVSKLKHEHSKLQAQIEVDALAIKDQLQKFSESKSEMERHFETNTKADFVNNCSELIYCSERPLYQRARAVLRNRVDISSTYSCELNTDDSIIRSLRLRSDPDAGKKLELDETNLTEKAREQYNINHLKLENEKLRWNLKQKDTLISNLTTSYSELQMLYEWLRTHPPNESEHGPWRQKLASKVVSSPLKSYLRQPPPTSSLPITHLDEGKEKIWMSQVFEKMQTLEEALSTRETERGIESQSKKDGFLPRAQDDPFILSIVVPFAEQDNSVQKYRISASLTVQEIIADLNRRLHLSPLQAAQYDLVVDTKSQGRLHLAPDDRPKYIQDLYGAAECTFKYDDLSFCK